jgi:hypothetical protein
MKVNLAIIVLFLIANIINAQDSLSSSIYIGTATGTNVGGAVGIGVEIMLNKYFSGNLAIGSVHPILKEEVDKSKFDFDIGIKFYPIKYFFIGINYGLIDGIYSETAYSNGTTNTYYKETRGFSFSIGGKTPGYKKFYLSGFIGITDSEEANHGLRIIEDNSITPRLGILLGYCL